MRFKFGALMLLVGALFVMPAAAGAQAPTDTAARAGVSIQREVDSLSQAIREAVTRDSALQAAIDSLDTRLAQKRAQKREQDREATVRFALLGAAALATNAIVGFERDPGGYQDTYWSQDKFGHFTGAMFLTSQAMRMLGVPRWRAVVVTCALGYGFEHSQAIGGGFVSNRDAVVTCGGAVLEGITDYLEERRQAWQGR